MKVQHTARRTSHRSLSRPWRPLPVHTAVAGRARLKVPALYRGDGLKEPVESRLQALGGVLFVRVNILTGSLLIEFESGLALDEVLALIEKVLADLPCSPRACDFGNRTHFIRRSKQPEPEPAPDGSAAETRWHALSPAQVYAEVNSTESGLSAALAAERLARTGPNALPKPARRSEFSLLLEQFASPPVAMLGTSAVISILTGGSLDAAVIMSVVLINTLIGFFTERQSEKTIAALTPAVSAKASVLRDQRLCEAQVENLVPGDVIMLKPGRYIAADIRLLRAERLSLDESALTGESMPVEKNAGAPCPEEAALGDRRNMAYMGTFVTGGSGAGMVVGTGSNTEIGRIQSMAEGAAPPKTVVERQLDELGGQLVLLSSAICGAVFAVGLLRGHGWLAMLKSSIALAVAAVPEGLPTVATTTLAIGIGDMRKRNVLVRRLDAVETLGAVQVFCLDKTGTLTTNHMQVVALHLGMRDVSVEDRCLLVAGQRIEPLAIQELRRLLETVALCNEVEFDASGGGLCFTGSATETALVELAVTCGLDVAALRRRHPRLSIQHRAENRPFMVTLHRLGAKRRLVMVKGSPEPLLGLCRRHLRNGRRRVLKEAERTEIIRANERMAGAALRVLGVAYAIRDDADGEPLEDLIWLGLAGMADPLRPGMTELLKRFHRAGIETSIITGDQSATAYAVAKQLDLTDGHSLEILDSVSLDKMDQELLSGVIRHVQVFSRVSPAHKLEIVQALQRAGKIVAMTGDGVNDGPALKAADLGVALGGAGAEVARSVADIVVEDDNLTTMVTAIRDGRSIYDNIRKAIRFLLATNLSEIEVMLASIGLGLGQPLNPMQLLWINLATDIFPGLALAMEQPAADILERPPRDPEKPIIDRRDLGRLGLESAVISGGALASYGVALLRYGPGPKANTYTFMTLTLAQLLHALSSRSEDHSLLDRERLPRNPYLEAALAGSLVAQGLTVLVPGLRRILGTVPLSLADGLVIAAGATAPLLINEVTKKIAASRDRR